MKNLVWLATTVFVIIFAAQNVHALNLKQKKYKQNAEEKVEEIKKDIKKVCGCVPEVKVAWETLKTKKDFLIPSRVLSNAESAMGRLCKDFKKEVCAGIKTISISKGKLEKAYANGELKLSREDYGTGNGGVRQLLEENL